MHYLNLGCGSHFHPTWTNVDFVSTGEGVIAHNLRQRFPFSHHSFDAVYHSHVLEHLPRSEAKPFLQECYRVLRPGGVLRVVVPDLEQIARLYLKALDQIDQGDRQWLDHYNWLLLELYDQVVRTRPGGEMAAYLAQAELPNEAFVIERVGREAKNLIAVLRQPGSFPFPEPPLTERETWLKQLLGDEDYHALQVGRFRQGGEVHHWMYDRHSLTHLLAQVGFEQIRVCQADESAIPEFGQYHLDVEPDGRVRKPDSLFVEAMKPATSPSSENEWIEETTEAIAPPMAWDDLPQVQALQAEIQQLQATVDQTRRQFERSQSRLEQTQQELEQSQSIISAMESSKFWQLRSLWFKLKQLMGITNQA